MNSSLSLKAIVKICIRRFLSCFPIQKNKVIFLNFDGRGFGDNPKYIAEEIVRQKLPWKLIWLVRNSDDVPNSIKKVGIGGFHAFYELSTARFIISNCKNNIPSAFFPHKKKNQFYLQTWHGDFALKYIEKEIEDTFSPGYLVRSRIDSKATDAILSGNKQFSVILKDSFWLPSHCAILEFGVPRNDLYFRGEEVKKKIKERYGFSLNDRILLYAPTFRDNFDFGCYNIDFERLRRALPQSCNTVWRIIIRLHPRVSSRADFFRYDDNIIDGSVYSDQQELCMISDGLITDYSSIMGDFILMKKPVFLYVPDLEIYANQKTGRGLRDLYYQMPFPFCYNQLELESCLSEFNKADYRERLSEFKQKYYDTFDDGHASERVVDYLKYVQS